MWKQPTDFFPSIFPAIHGALIIDGTIAGKTLVKHDKT
jgi:hypothetical protein